MDEVHEGLQIRRAPPPLEISFRKSEIPFPDQPSKNVWVVNIEFCNRTRVFAVNSKPAAVRKHKIKAPILKFARDIKGLCKISRKVLLSLGTGQNSHRSSHFFLSLQNIAPSIKPERANRPNGGSDRRSARARDRPPLTQSVRDMDRWDAGPNSLESRQNSFGLYPKATVRVQQ